MHHHNFSTTRTINYWQNAKINTTVLKSNLNKIKIAFLFFITTAFSMQNVLAQVQCNAYFKAIQDTPEYKTYHFKDMSTSDSKIISWYWDFGDGNYSNLQNPDHAFLNCNGYSLVYLTSTDSLGCSSVYSEYVYFSIDLYYSVTPDQVNFKTIHFNDQSVFNSKDLTWKWYFGDGDSLIAQSPSHTYASCNYYYPYIYVTDTLTGCVNGNTYYVNVAHDVSTSIVVDSTDNMLVHFNGSSSTNPAVWNWDFGDGDTSSLQNTSHKYVNCGEYYSTLTASNSDSSCANSTSNYIKTGNLYPNFGFTTDSLSYKTYHFTDYSSSTDTVNTWAWDFGDGTSSTLQNPSHTYDSCTYYYPTLTVTDKKGCQLIYSSYLYPYNDIWASSTQDSLDFKKIQFNVYSSYPVLNWSWDFGDGTTSVSQNPSHTYLSCGYYYANVTGSDLSGCSSSAGVDVNVGGIYASFGYSNAGKQVAFTDYSSSPNQIKSWLWDFGDGSTSTLQNPVHVFSNCDYYYNVILTVTDSVLCSMQTSQSVYIYGSYANFYTTVDSTNLTYFYDQSSSYNTITSYKWTFGDGTSSTLQNPTHTYTVCNDHNVMLIVTDDIGCKDTITNTIYKPNVYSSFWSETDYNDISNKTIKLYNQSCCNTSYLWQFGDGFTSTLANPIHTYADYGLYNVCLTVSSGGCSDTLCQQVVASANYDCYASMGYYTDDKNSLIIHFDDYSYSGSGSISKRTWDFGDGTTSTLKSPAHTYSSCGGYNVTLTIQDPTGCFSTTSNYVYVGSNPNFYYNQDTSNYRKFSFSLGEVPQKLKTIKWDFGNGNTSNLLSPIYTFTECDTNSYNYLYLPVTVTLTDSSVCVTSTTNWVYIDMNPNVSITSDTNNYTIKNFSVNFWNNINTTGFKWKWTFGDGDSSLAQNTTHTYSECGYYNVNLNITDNVGCVTSYNNYGTNVGPDLSVTYTFDDINPNQIHFFGSSSSAVQNWSWDFDNSAFTSSLQNPTYTRVLNCGDYVYANVSISDSSGCTASTQIGIDLNLWTYFWYNNDMYDSKLISFFSNTEGNPTVHNWDFGDGTTSNLANPVHNYANSGQYYVCLQTYNAAGCSSSYCSYVYIYCQNSTDFAFVQDTGNIYNFKFTDASTGDRTNWFWDFGDGNYSSEKNPTHTYNYSGYFYTCLTVYDSLGGCQSSNCYYIEIYDPNIVTCAAYFYSDTDTINPNLILFTNSSLGNMTNWYWDFGDGNSSDKKNPKNVYTTPGYYNICMYGWDSVSYCQNYYCESIKVGNDSTVCYTYADYTTFPLGGNSISFNNKSSDYSYSYWDFGDGNSSYDVNPTYTYANGGYYNICLTVYNGFYNCTDYECKYIKVGDDSTNCYTYANYSQFPDGSGNGVYFENYSAGFTDIYWDFGDGNYSYDYSVYHLYSDAGYYNVCLYVSDYNTGCQDYICNYIKVGSDTLSCYTYASFYSIPDTAGSGVSFRNTSKGYSSSYWDFGDGYVSYENNPYHVYTYGGYFYVCLSIYDSTGCYENTCQYVKAGELDSNATSCYVRADFSYFPDTVGNGISFTNLSIGYTDLHWDFGDSKYSLNKNPYHKYTEAGYYYVCLNAYDSITSCANYWCMYVKAGEADSVQCPAIAKFSTVTDTSGYGVQFKNNSSGYTSVYWDFGDGDFSVKVNPYHVYDDGAYYQVCLTITNDTSNCTQYVCKNVKTGVDTNVCSVNAEFSYIPVNNSTSVNFSNKSTGYTDIFWEFGDGDFSSKENPSHAYSSEGIYTTCVTAMYLGNDTCIQTSCKNILVTLSDTSAVTGCLADFTVVVDSTTLTATFTDKSLGSPDYWYWNFNDFTVSSSEQNPSHTFANEGYYEVCLTIYKGSDCKNTYCKVIAVGDVSNSVFAKFNYLADSLTSTAFFKDKSFGAITSWNWDFGDDQQSSFQNPAHTYPDTGSYLACLTVKNANNVKGTKCKNIRIGNTLANACKFSCVWPGDANYSLESNHYDLLAIGFNYGLTGPIRDSISTRWIGHYGTNWSTQMSNGINNKHSDCNGDGIVDLTDLDAIIQNFAFSHPYQPGKTGKSYNAANPDLYFEITDGQDIAPGSSVEVSIMAGRDTTSLYGIAFEFNFDKSKVKENSFATTYDNSWLGNKTTELITYDKTDYSLGQTFVGMTRFNKAEQNGLGNITTFSFVIDSSFTNSDELVICVNTDYGMDANGDTVTFNSDFCDTLKTAGVNPGFENSITIENINLYPNPTNGRVSFKLPYISEGVYEIELLNTLGQVAYSKVLNSGGYQILDMSKVESGLYFVNIRSSNNIYTQKLNIITR